MSLPDDFLLCFAVGSMWALASLVLGGMHVGHGHVHVHGHAGSPHVHGASGHSHTSGPSRLGALVNPSVLAVFLAWFGGVGYLLSRYSGLVLWLNVVLSIAAGSAGAFVLASFFSFLQRREQPLDPRDFEMVGVLGQVSSPVRADGIGEVLYIREGTRRCIPARSEDHLDIGRGREVIVVRYERGIAYVRTWEAMTQDAGL